MTTPTTNISPLPQGKTALVLSATPTEAGTTSRTFSTDADSVLLSLFVTSITGTFDLVVSTFTEEGKEFTVATFPSINAATSNLVIKKAAAILSNLKITTTYTGACEFEVRARGIGSGETSVKILGSSNARASQITVGTTPQVLLPLAFSDRNGLVLRNWNQTASVLYIGFDASECLYPVAALEQMAMDIEAGVTVYAYGTVNIDVRIMEGGS